MDTNTTNKTASTLGTELPPSSFTANQSVIGEVVRTPAGNVSLRVGRVIGTGWEQTEYITLTPGEVARLVSELLQAVER